MSHSQFNSCTMKSLKGTISPLITPILIWLMKFEWLLARQSLCRKNAKVWLEKYFCYLTVAYLFSQWRSSWLSKHSKWSFSKSFSNSSSANYNIESTDTTNGTTVGLIRTRADKGERGRTGTSEISQPHQKRFNSVFWNTLGLLLVNSVQPVSRLLLIRHA